MSIIKNSIVSLISAITIISCGKSGDNKKSESKPKNTSILSVWEGTLDLSGTSDKAQLQIDLTKAIVGSTGTGSIKLSKDANYIKCIGNIELKGSNITGNMKFSSMSASSYYSSSKTVTKIEADTTCITMSTNLNIENAGKGLQYTFKDGTLEICDGTGCKNFN
ncbi:hypothetical protein QEJ31_14930 [Pigmentibacter sp. JX0631]|uniref:hypothetical protein n=1 Tax=Pigmentibacter sp. JX0631 TaxID=2976982 RepID=UPI00246916FC|nr:hypothetical protein [Pigmentibacter sp. JX0631]WGL59823.1 hypothetical protein QEJ31_14930 [Pigmentibacter sp. JX0631]